MEPSSSSRLSRGREEKLRTGFPDVLSSPAQRCDVVMEQQEERRARQRSMPVQRRQMYEREAFCLKAAELLAGTEARGMVLRIDDKAEVFFN